MPAIDYHASSTLNDLGISRVIPLAAGCHGIFQTRYPPHLALYGYAQGRVAVCHLPSSRRRAALAEVYPCRGLTGPRIKDIETVKGSVRRSRLVDAGVYAANRVL